VFDTSVGVRGERDEQHANAMGRGSQPVSSYACSETAPMDEVFAARKRQRNILAVSRGSGRVDVTSAAGRFGERQRRSCRTMWFCLSRAVTVPH